MAKIATWTNQTYAFGSLLTATKMTQLFNNVDFVRENMMNALTAAGTLDLTLSPVVTNVDQMFFSGGAGTGIDTNGLLIQTNGGDLDLNGGAILNEGVGGVPTVLAGGVTTAQGANAGELVDTKTSFDFSTELTAGENFVTISVSYTTLMFHVTSLVDADTIVIGVSDNIELADILPLGVGYSVYSNLYKASWALIDSEIANIDILTTTSAGQMNKIFKIEVGSVAGTDGSVVALTHNDNDIQWTVTDIYNENSGSSVSFIQNVTATSTIHINKDASNTHASLFESITLT